jgi:hypothetical protein
MDAHDLGVRRDRVADEHGRRELPVLAEEDAARPWKIHRHQRVQKAGREATLHDQLLELRSRREVPVEMDRVVVARDLGERAYVIARERQRARGALTDCHCHFASACFPLAAAS